MVKYEKNCKYPPQEFHLNSELCPNIKEFIYELRINILKITIEQFVFNLNWNNEKYYQQIVNGYKDKNGIRKYKQPTIKYIFSGLNFAMNNFDHWKANKEQIIELIFKYIVKF